MTSVLVIDDSAMARRLLCELIARIPGMRVVGTAGDPYEAREQIAKLSPDVLTLDVEMPRMDGLSFLAALMQSRPMPVIIVSSLTPEGSAEALRAYELGAIEVVGKPGSAFSVADLGPALRRALRSAAVARPDRRAPPPAAIAREKLPVLSRTTQQLLAIGASTGGTEAIRSVLEKLPGDTPGTVIVQHMPPQFTTSFAKRLDSLSAMRVAEAHGGEELLPGLAFVAPGGHHLVVLRSGAKYVLQLRDGPEVHFQKPAVDITFRSVAKAAGGNAIGVLLTGMGEDGAEGLLEMRRAGARTIAQDEATSVVWGMPGAAVKLDAAQDVLPLASIPQHLARWRATW
jgi:two-component system chemotaxis response regulator CheB